jgi:L-alanine-DL-glutamate epimerase-like enolase superfamily enzyme
MRTTDITVRDVAVNFEDYQYRTPIKFGGVVLDKVTILNVTMTVETGAGKRATGFGSMPLGNVWAWPTKELNYDQTLAGMKYIAGRISGPYRMSGISGHPFDITDELEPRFFLPAQDFAQMNHLAQPVPKLVTLVVASAFDAALHDGYGKVHGLNCYKTYGPEFLHNDLGHYLGDEFAGERVDHYITTEPKERMPLYHLVGALDPLTPAEVVKPVGDGLPEHLGEWIRREGLTHFKIKLNGDDLIWDVERVAQVDAVAELVQTERGVTAWRYSLDFNEKCKNVEYLLEFIRMLQVRAKRAFDRVQYIEQPTARDLKAHPENKMHEAAKFKPVVIDESLIDLDSLHLAREMGYTGVAFKACKGQTDTLLLAAAAQKYGMFRCVQDLTCPGASLIHSAGLAAHIPGVAAIEANARQYCPAANQSWDAKFPGVFTIRDGAMNTAILNGPGLGAV